MDNIIALYSNDEIVDRMRRRLYEHGFPAERLDVVSWHKPGRIVEEPARDREDNLIAHFATLMPEDGDVPVIVKIIKALREGKVAVIVQPRGSVEVVQARGILASHTPEIQVWRIAARERLGGWSEHA